MVMKVGIQLGKPLLSLQTPNNKFYPCALSLIKPVYIKTLSDKWTLIEAVFTRFSIKISMYKIRKYIKNDENSYYFKNRVKKWDH